MAFLPAPACLPTELGTRPARAASLQRPLRTGSGRRPVLSAAYGQNNRARTERESEIAAKIARLKRRKGLNARQTKDGTARDAEPPAAANNPGATEEARSRNDQQHVVSPTGVPPCSAFDDLPDWKKEQILLHEMDAAEAFLGTSPGKTSDSARPGDTEKSNGKQVINYKPKVNTWGVFPRPENISEAYGGGRNIPIGGSIVPGRSDDPQALRREQSIKEALARYRKGQGIDVEREQRHEPEIADAMQHADRLMTRAIPYDAVRKLEAVQHYVSPRSKRGGEVYMKLALAYEATGQTERAKQIYLKLKQSPFQQVSRPARRLLSGFDAMEKLRIVADTSENGPRVTRFKLPDVAAYTDKRYETAVFVPQQKSLSTNDVSASEDDKDSSLTALVLLCLIALPVALVVLHRFL